mmetsp:Transcript_24495/g.61612  ORF Transcript_24495/g.61612 Transcript_24495/m.61612 type:complete len:1119 (-) Transcript_24495:208-3564(-)|eukprot:CAMPEP_0178988810 /NCGR_PEP_ID=MMETSP0795-20121207/4009_1 /TAXON_ID=88552 /ORGANISM="Amoebophrya sp., Strain Ameob2" /LENGTH=1118 /DNA_ID=CAMNT_0020680109 /DNA_START=88 /DNA_END=3444 /DNA_ORIENTATION=-
MEGQPAAPAAPSTALLLGCPFHLETGVCLDRLHSDFDAANRYCNFVNSLSLPEDDPEAPFGATVDARNSVLDGALSCETVADRLAAFVKATYNASAAGSATAKLLPKIFPTAGSELFSPSSRSKSTSAKPWAPRVVVFGGHGREETGNWILSDGDFPFERFLEVLLDAASQPGTECELAMRAAARGDGDTHTEGDAAKRRKKSNLAREIVVVLDCCYSGVWVRKFHQLAKLDLLMSEWRRVVGLSSVSSASDAELAAAVAQASRPRLADLMLLERDGVDAVIRARQQSVFEKQQDLSGLVDNLEVHTSPHVGEKDSAFYVEIDDDGVPSRGYRFGTSSSELERKRNVERFLELQGQQKRMFHLMQVTADELADKNFHDFKFRRRQFPDLDPLFALDGRLETAGLVDKDPEDFVPGSLTAEGQLNGPKLAAGPPSDLVQFLVTRAGRGAGGGGMMQNVVERGGGKGGPKFDGLAGAAVAATTATGAAENKGGTSSGGAKGKASASNAKMSDDEYFCDLLLKAPGSLFPETERKRLCRVRELWRKVFSTAKNSRVRLCLQSACAGFERAFDGVFLSSWLLVHRQEMGSRYALKHFSLLRKHPLYYVCSSIAPPGARDSGPMMSSSQSEKDMPPLVPRDQRPIPGEEIAGTFQEIETDLAAINAFLRAEGEWRSPGGVTLLGTHAEQSQPAFLPLAPEFVDDGGSNKKPIREVPPETDGVSPYATVDPFLPLPLPRRAYERQAAEQLVRRMNVESENAEVEDEEELPLHRQIAGIFFKGLGVNTTGRADEEEETKVDPSGLDPTSKATWSLVQFLYFDANIRDVGTVEQAASFVKTLVTRKPCVLSMNTLYLFVARLPQLALLSFLSLKREASSAEEGREDGAAEDENAAQREGDENENPRHPYAVLQRFFLRGFKLHGSADGRPTSSREALLGPAAALQLLSQLHVAYGQRAEFVRQLRGALVCEEMVVGLVQDLPVADSLLQLQLYALWNTVREPELALRALECGAGAKVIVQSLQNAAAVAAVTSTGGETAQANEERTARAKTRMNMTRRIWAVKVLWLLLKLSSTAGVNMQLVVRERLPAILSDMLARETREGWICTDQDWDTLFQCRRLLGMPDDL